MARVVVKFLDWDARRQNGLGLFNEDSIPIVETLAHAYTSVATFDVVADNDEDAAEEVFDISNNPSRDAARHQLFGSQRSFSSGDIVEVNGTNYLCMSCNWAIVNLHSQ